jgi:hypothetical protein
MIAYQQPLGDAIAITVTAVLLTGGALVLARDWGGHNSRLAAEVAARNRRAPFRWFLLTKSARTFNTDANRVKAMNAQIAYFCAGLGIVMLVVEFVAILSNGIR